MKKKGFFWHVHHDELVEYCYDYQERVDFIKDNKPADEVEARLALFKPVKGNLPVEFDKAWEAYYKAWEACKQEIVALHDKECPNCIWDGEKLDFAKWKA